MTCKWCGSDRHLSDECPTLNLVRFFNELPYDENNMPDLVTVLDFEELIDGNGRELHDEIRQINKVHLKGESKDEN